MNFYKITYGVKIEELVVSIMSCRTDISRETLFEGIALMLEKNYLIDSITALEHCLYAARIGKPMWFEEKSNITSYVTTSTASIL